MTAELMKAYIMLVPHVRATLQDYLGSPGRKELLLSLVVSGKPGKSAIKGLFHLF